MAISDKLTYLSETKNQLKTTINYAGAGLTDETFRQYPEKLYNKYLDILKDNGEELFNGLPKVTNSGTSITLNNIANTRMGLELAPSTLEQATTTGKNLYEGSQDFSGTWVNGGTWETDSETYNGLVVKKRKNAWGGLYKEFNVEAGETYTFSVYIKSDSPRTVYLYNAGGSATATLTYIGSEQKTTTTEWQRYSVTINVTSSGTIHPRVEGTNTGTTYYNYICGYQLEKNSQATSYEPFTNGASPNPDYPQDIHTVSGNNEIVVGNKNLFKISGYSKTGWVMYIDNPLKGQSAGQYTISCVNNYGNAGKGVRTYFTNEIGGSIINSVFTDYSFANTHQSVTRELTQEQLNANYMVLYPNDSAGNLQVIENMQIQIEKSSTATPYTPHQEQLLPLNLPVENLFDGTNYQGYITSDGQINTSDAKLRRTDYIAVKPNAQYTVSTNTSMFALAVSYYDSAKTFISRNQNLSVNSVGFTTPSNARYVIIAINYNNSSNLDSSSMTTYQLQLEPGTKANSYTPYGTTPIEYCKIGNYEDEFVYNTTDSSLELNKWYLKKNIGKVVLDGSENWSLYLKTFNCSNLGTGKPTNALCNSFINKGENWVSSDESNRGKFSMNNTANNFKCMPLTDMTLEQWITYVSANNILAYYSLSTPTYILLNDTLQSQLDEIYNKALSYQDQTNISQVNNDLSFVISASAIKEYDLNDE